MGRVISTAIQFIDGFTRPSREVIQSMRQMGNEAIKAGKQIQNAGKTIANAGATLTKAVTLPIAGVATAAIKMSNDFENAMAKVGTIADTTNTPMTALKEQVIDRRGKHHQPHRRGNSNQHRKADGRAHFI